MKKPVKPKEIKIPDILKTMISPGYGDPLEYFEETIYKTPTNFEIKYDKFKKNNPNASQKEIVDYFQENENWDIEFNKDGTIEQIDCNDPYYFDNPNDFVNKSKAISLVDILAKVDKKDYPMVKIDGVAHYKGDYLYGGPGIHVFILRKNPNYEEQVKANKKYRRALDKQWKLECQYNKDLELYKQEREDKIKAKIKEMEEHGEI